MFNVKRRFNNHSSKQTSKDSKIWKNRLRDKDKDRREMMMAKEIINNSNCKDNNSLHNKEIRSKDNRLLTNPSTKLDRLQGK